MIRYKEDFYDEIYDNMRDNCPLLWELINNTTEREKKKLLDIALNHCFANLKYFINNNNHIIYFNNIVFQKKRTKHRHFKKIIRYIKTRIQ